MLRRSKIAPVNNVTRTMNLITRIISPHFPGASIYIKTACAAKASSKRIMGFEPLIVNFYFA